jgi:iron complex outermembrane receptor protein
MASLCSPRRPCAIRSQGARALRFRLRPLALLCAAAFGSGSAHAQATAPTATVTITGRSVASAGLTGFGDQPLARSPFQVTSIGNLLLQDGGVATLGDLTRLDASVGDAYNAEGYWAILAVRGYTLDNRSNYRRDGLPINAETSIGLDNKERLEVLRGTSGMQAGTSSPGGLVNLVVKRPSGRLRDARLEWRQGGSMLAAVDLGDSFGADGAVGVRLNAAAERLRPQVRDSDGRRSLLALAVDLKLSADSLLQAEVESSSRRQPSVAGYSLLGNAVPDPRRIDLQRNLNAQPWAQPVEFDGNTASLRWQQRLAGDWRLTAQAMTQRLKTNDRTAFPYGVYDANYECPDWCDRFAPDGGFTYWQYVSDNERRDSHAFSVAATGSVQTGAVSHQLHASVLQTRYRGRFQDQVFDIAGPGNIDGSLQTPPAFGYTDANTNRDERSTELQLSDVVQLAPQLQLWAGLRHTRLERQSQRTSPASDGLRATDYTQALTTPWLALTHAISAQSVAYLSWGQGIESEVAPNRARYTNSGQALPALKSRQVELGFKHASDGHSGAITVFDIDRPRAADIGACDVDDSCTRRIDGSQRHRGVEVQGSVDVAAWTWQLSALWLDAERRGTSRPDINGTRPENVPKATLRMGAEWRVPAITGLVLQANLAAESDRVVLPYDPTIRIAGWSRLDLGARWRQPLGTTTLTWRAGIDNLTDRRAWKESPYQFGHAYLYALAPRTWRASVTASF